MINDLHGRMLNDYEGRLGSIKKSTYLQKGVIGGGRYWICISRKSGLAQKNEGRLFSFKSLIKNNMLHLFLLGNGDISRASCSN